jgi:type II secretory pathway pseudopilin PulG
MKTASSNVSCHVKSRTAQTRQHGASLLEAIAFLGIAAIVILGAIALLMSGFSGANTNRALEEVGAVRTGVKRLYMGQSASYGTEVLNPSLIAAKVFPTTLAVEGANVLNAWNGPVTVTGQTANFEINYANVPKDVCISMASSSGDWLGVTVNGTALTMPATPQSASDACTQASNDMAWTAN